jgi:tail fiber adhesin Gp38
VRWYQTAKWLLGRLTRAAVTSLVPQPGTPPPKFPVAVAITSSTNNLNLWDYLVANGHATSGTPGSWIVSIASNVTIGSSSTTTPALDIGAVPSGSNLQLVNYGTIVGAGGDGGRGGRNSTSVIFCSGTVQPTPGASGGAALRTLVAVSITNYGSIWAGAGGGGGGNSHIISKSCSVSGTGGGGGGGWFPGPGGPGGGGRIPAGPNANPGNPGTIAFGGLGGLPLECATLGDINFGKRGGPGGNPGLVGGQGEAGTCGPGAPGGPPGPAVIGNAPVTWVAVGDRRGPLN